MSHPLVLSHSGSLPPSSCLSNRSTVPKFRGLRETLGIGRYSRSCAFGRSPQSKAICHLPSEERNCKTSDILTFHVQTLRKFPIEKLRGKVAIVRLDSSLLLEQLHINNQAVSRTLSTIKYLYNAGAKLLLASSWGQSTGLNCISTESFADYLSGLLHLEVTPATVSSYLTQFKTNELKKSDILLLENLAKFRGELTNCAEFSRELSSGAYIFVNDAFSLSHKILASTVGISRFCDASVAGFCFEEELLQVTKAKEATRHPYIAIIGGSKFLEKAPAVHLLGSICDGLIFVGKLAFQILHALGVSVPSSLLEKGASKEALKLIQLAKSRRIAVYCPEDIWCSNSSISEELEIFPSDSIMAGWTPLALGPVSLKEISALISKCKKVLWIGPANFDSSVNDTDGESELASMLERISSIGCEVLVVGNAASRTISRHCGPFSPCKVIKNASAVWEFLKGRTLPGVAALDRAYPFDLDWNSIFAVPTQSLIVDIGSGNGLFLLNMAKRWKHTNFLGLEINDKLVKRCQKSVLESGITNAYFISTNATFSFRSLVSSYPGDLILALIQCPDPDFNKEEHRWRMVQTILVEAITDLLVPGGKIFLQSDIEAVSLRMKEQFMMYGKETLVIDGGDDEGWLLDNPFGVRSDWEQHVIDRGDTMYRLMLRKIS